MTCVLFSKYCSLRNRPHWKVSQCWSTKHPCSWSTTYKWWCSSLHTIGRPPNPPLLWKHVLQLITWYLVYQSVDMGINRLKHIVATKINKKIGHFVLLLVAMYVVWDHIQKWGVLFIEDTMEQRLRSNCICHQGKPHYTGFHGDCRHWNSLRCCYYFKRQQNLCQ